MLFAIFSLVPNIKISAMQVDYVADHGGFRAQIKTNEPGTTGQSPAAVKMTSNDPYAHGAVFPYVSLPNVPFVPALYESSGPYGFRKYSYCLKLPLF